LLVYKTQALDQYMIQVSTLTGAADLCHPMCGEGEAVVVVQKSHVHSIILVY